ncbi:MAG: acyl-CoA dehydrogenase [Rhodospirillales bacterium]|nr:acyl-CoA dehydrogenase [Rhodospirillales bacterium]
MTELDDAAMERLNAFCISVGEAAAGAVGIRFRDVAVDEGTLIHPPGEAFKGAMHGITIARAGVAAMSCGMMEASLRHALDGVKGRTAFGQTIGDFQGVQWMLADAATDLEAARLLTRHACELFDACDAAMVACAHARKFATRAACKAISDGMQVMGARGFRIDDGHPVARHLAGARMAQWLNGATEIQNVVIARHLMKNGS